MEYMWMWVYMSIYREDGWRGVGTPDGRASSEFYPTIREARLGSGPRPTVATTRVRSCCSLQRALTRVQTPRERCFHPSHTLPPVLCLSRTLALDSVFPSLSRGQYLGAHETTTTSTTKTWTRTTNTPSAYRPHYITITREKLRGKIAATK